MFSNRVEITLVSILGTKILQDDPIGHDQSETNIMRSEKSHGIFLTHTNNLEFTGDSKRYLENLYNLKGIQAKCQLIRKEKHPTTDDWQLHSTGYLDFFSRKIKDNKLQLDFVEGGLREILTSQMREKFELNRVIDINGNTIPELETDILSNKGRDIYLLSKFNERITFFTTKSGRWKSVDENRPSFHPIPLTVSANVDNTNVQEPQESYREEERYKESLLNMFFSIADRDRGLTRFSGKATFKVEGTQQPNMNSFDMNFVLKRFTSDPDGTNLVFKDILFTFPMGDPAPGTEFIIDVPEIILYPLLNESYALGFDMIGQYGSGFPGYTDGFKNINFIDLKANFMWAEDSFFKRTNSPCLTAYNVGKRLSEIYTGKNCFESYLLDGKDPEYLKNEDHNLLFAPGGWLRNLKKKDENGNLLPWPMEMNFEDFYKSIHAILPVGYGITTVGNSQKLILEKLGYFFQRTVTVNLGKIQIKGRSIAVEYCYQSLKFGYVKGGEYEQPLGLDEYNTQTNYRSPLTVTDNIYEALGPSRTDSYGAEQTRRKQFEDFPDEDTNADKDNFLFDAKFSTRSNASNYFEVRLWSDDFESTPTGIYSPETAFNLNLSPARNKQRHEFWWGNSIIMLQDEVVQFVNSKGNSELKTKKPGEDPLKERENTPVSKIQNPIFKPEWIDAEAPFNKNLLEQIQGKTLINGRMVNNYYGLAEFINEQNRPEYAYIFTVKSKDKFTFKLLKAYGI